MINSAESQQGRLEMVIQTLSSKQGKERTLVDSFPI